MKSAATKAAAVQKKLEKKLAMKRPWFPAAWRKSIDKLRQEYAYWSQLAAKEESNALSSFGQATGLDALLGSSAASVPVVTSAPVVVEERPLWQHPAVIVGSLVFGVAVVGTVLMKR